MKVLFIPHSPLQFEVFSLWAGTLNDLGLTSICLLMSSDLEERVLDNYHYDEVIHLEKIPINVSEDSMESQILYLSSFEKKYKAHFTTDWTIDRAFQNFNLSYKEAVSFSFQCLSRIQNLFTNNNIVMAVSEKLFLPQRIVHHILNYNGKRHLLPIGDRFFKRFYFEDGLNDWSYNKIQESYVALKSVKDPFFHQDVRDVFDKIVYRKFKKVFSDSKKEKVSQRFPCFHIFLS